MSNTNLNNSKFLQKIDYKVVIENKIIDFFGLKNEQLYDIEPLLQVFMSKLNIKDLDSEKVLLDLYFYALTNIKKDIFIIRLERSKYFYFDELLEFLKQEYLTIPDLPKTFPLLQNNVSNTKF